MRFERPHERSELKRRPRPDRETWGWTPRSARSPSTRTKSSPRRSGQCFETRQFGPAAARAARAEKMQFMQELGVFEDSAGPITSKWLDTDKGMDGQMLVRLVPRGCR